MKIHSDCQPLYQLILPYLNQHEIRLTQLVKHLGFKNINKKNRDLKQLLTAADLKSDASQEILIRIPTALNIELEAFQRAVQECQDKQQQRLTSEMVAKKREAQKNFTPYAILKGTYSRPTQITIYAMSGGANRWLNFKLDPKKSAKTYVPTVLAHLKDNPNITFWGPATGFVIHYEYGVASHYDLKGELIKVEQEAYLPGIASVQLGQRSYPESFFNYQ